MKWNYNASAELNSSQFEPTPFTCPRSRLYSMAHLIVRRRNKSGAHLLYLSFQLLPPVLHNLSRMLAEANICDVLVSEFSCS